MTTRDLVIVSVAAALSTALSFLRLFELPQGGSVTLDTLPIFYVAFWRGAGVGVSAGALSGLIQLLLRPFAVHPLQVLLDYPLAMGACGLAGFLRQTDSKRMLKIGLSVVGGLVLVVVAGLQWLELNRISRTNEVVLARSGDWQTVVRTRPDTTFGDVESEILSLRARSDGTVDTLGKITAHGESARQWLSQAVQTVRAEQMRWFGNTFMLLVALLGVALLARYLAVGAVGLGVLAGSAVKFGLHVVSGVVFFAAYAPVGESLWVYSAAYNATYIIPQTVFALVLLPPVLSRVRRADRISRSAE